MIGVWSQRKPRSCSQRWIAMAAALRTRKTAPRVFVRGRRWAMVRRNSKEWRFFCRG